MSQRSNNYSAANSAPAPMEGTSSVSPAQSFTEPVQEQQPNVAAPASSISSTGMDDDVSPYGQDIPF